MNEFLPMPAVPTNSASDEDSEYDRAIAYFDEVIRLKPSDAVAYCKRGLAYVEQGDYDRAIADLTESIRLVPKYANVDRMRGVFYTPENKYKRTIAEAYYFRGLAYGEQGDYDRAIADLTESIRLVPKYTNAYQMRGIFYTRTNKYKRAIADYTEVIRLDPYVSDAYDNPYLLDAYEMRALAYRAIGKQRKADCDDREAESLKPPKDPKTSTTTLTIWMTAGGAFANTYDKKISVLIDDKEEVGQVGEPIEVEPGQRTAAIKGLGGCSNRVTVAVQNHDKIDLVCGVSRESILILGILSAIFISLIHARNKVWFGFGFFVPLSLHLAGWVTVLKPIWAIDTFTLRRATSDTNIPRTKHNYSWLAAICILYGLFIWCRAALLP